MVSEKGDAVICAPRPGMDRPPGWKKDLGEAGFLYLLSDVPYLSLPKPVHHPIEAAPPPPDMENLADALREAVKPLPAALLAEKLGLSEFALDRLELGWSGAENAWTFPMRDATNRIIGFRCRNEKGDKWAIRGSHNGLFIPRNLTGQGELLICEGPTDTAAALDLGFDAVGRPNCSAGVELLADWMGRTNRPVIIIADADQAGWYGSRKLVENLRHAATDIRIISPPRAKDLRAWKHSGADQETVLAMAENTRREP